MSDVPGPVVYISIGNSDDKLSQLQWADLWEGVARIIDRFVETAGMQIVGAWTSDPKAWFQNACWAVAVPASTPDEHVLALRAALRSVAHAFRQDSIAWAWCPSTEFLTPA